MTNDSESFEKKGLDFNTAAGPQAFGDSVVSKRHRELTEANLRNSGSSSAWCSAHYVSAAAGRMFEDPEFLRIASVRRPWSLEQLSSGPVHVNHEFLVDLGFQGKTQGGGESLELTVKTCASPNSHFTTVFFVVT